MGISAFLDPTETCGDSSVVAGDTCVTTSVSGGHVTSSSRKFDQREIDVAERNRRILGGVGMVVGPVLLFGTCWLSVRSIRSGRPVRARLSLTAEQAYGGGTEAVEFRGWARCTHCSGSGVRAGGTRRRCLWCNGNGSGLGKRALRSATVRVPAGVKDGSTLRVRGRGAPGRGGDPAGDLLLSVRISGSRPVPGAAPPGPRTRTAPPRPRAGGAPRTQQQGAAGSRDTGAGPVSICVDGIRITVDQEAVTVREERRSPTGRTSWVTTHELRWPDIALLVFDSDRHDPVAALYAVPADAARAGYRRQHLLDARKFTVADWEAPADGIGRHSHGRNALDTAPCQNPGGLRDS